LPRKRHTSGSESGSRSDTGSEVVSGSDLDFDLVLDLDLDRGPDPYPTWTGIRTWTGTKNLNLRVSSENMLQKLSRSRSSLLDMRDAYSSHASAGR